MSMLIETVNTFAPITADGGGISGMIDGLTSSWNSTLTGVGRFGITAFFIFLTFKGGFTPGKLLLNAVLAGLFLFFLSNPDFFAGKADEELNGAPTVVSVVDVGAHDVSS